MPEPPSSSEGFRFLLVIKIFDFLFKILKIIGLWILCRYTYFSVKELAGKTTIADFLFQYFTRESRYHWLPWVLVALFFVWAILERSLRLKKVASMQKHILELEKRLDPNRTSSMLTHKGETNPEDIDL